MPKPDLELPCGFVSTPPSLFLLGTSKGIQGTLAEAEPG